MKQNREKKEKRKKERYGKDEEELVNDISFLFIFFSTFWVLVFERRKVLSVEDCEREREAK